MSALPMNRKSPDWRNGLDWSLDPYGNPPLPHDYDPNDPRFQQPADYVPNDPRFIPPTALPQAPPSVSGGAGVPEWQEEPVGPQGGAQEAGAAQGLPQAPPSARRLVNPNPWARENLSRTLADTGAAFLSNDGLAAGFGAAAQAIAGRKEALEANQYGKRSVGGPNDSFEIIEHPDGRREYIPIQPIVDHQMRTIAANKGMGQKDLNEQRTQLAGAVMALPEGQRAVMWADILANPDQYGLQSTDGLPAQWSESYGQTMTEMGVTQAQRNSAKLGDKNHSLQQQRFEFDRAYRERQQSEREQQNQWRRSQPTSSSRGPSYGSDLDY